MLTPQQVLDQFKGRIHCSQVVLGEYAEQLGYDIDEARKIANPFGGGMFLGDTCGAVAGAMIAIGMRFGNSEHGDMEQDDLCQAKVKELQQRFIARHGSTICRELLGFDFSDDEQKVEAFRSGRVKEVCPGYVLSAIEILEEIL